MMALRTPDGRLVVTPEQARAISEGISQRADQLRDLINSTPGAADVAMSPQSEFEIDLTDFPQVALTMRRPNAFFHFPLFSLLDSEQGNAG